MRIAHFVGHSLVRYTPGRIATYWGRYTKHEAMAFAVNRSGGVLFNEPLNPYGFHCTKSGAKRFAREWVRDCDVIHCHDDSYPTRVEERIGVDLRGKRLIYHAHIGNIPERYFGPSGIKKFAWRKDTTHVGITNGYGHLFDEHERQSRGRCKWGRLPDILDLDHPVYLPDPSLRDGFDGPLRLCYTYSNNREDGKINAKRPRAHMRLIGQVKGVEATFIHGRSFEESMAVKKRCHVVIEECFTPYLHLSALEGAAAGAAVVTQFDDRTVEETSRAVGAPIQEWPFIHADQHTLPQVLRRLDADRDLLRAAAEKARAWMLKYYAAPKLLQKYLDVYGKNP